MNTFVCIKQVPDTETKIRLCDDASHIDESGLKWVINPYDEFAIEEALRLKGALGKGKVTLVSLGPKKRVIEAIRTGLAMGADEGILIDSSIYMDAHFTAKALAAAIRHQGEVDLIFTGKLSIDYNTSSVSQMLAEQMGFPHATVVSKFSHSENEFTVERDIEGGGKEVLQLKGPSVIGVNKGLNTPRYASLPGIMKAKRKLVKEFQLEELNLDQEDQKVSFSDFELPPKKVPVSMIEGEVGPQCAELIKRLRGEAKVI